MYFLAGPPLAQTARAPSRGGKLVVGQEAEPKTLNPLFALDDPSKEVIGRLTADLISIDRQTQTAKPALAEWCHVSLDGLHYTIRLRSGLRFSDGHPFDADDVVFSLQVSLDEKVHAMQRDLLIIHGKPLSVVKMDAHTVRFDLPAVYGPGERLFDSVPMLPRHLLERAYQEGKLSEMWGLDTKPEEMAGMGPFRVKEYRAGKYLLLERNPYYWKSPLPYLDELEFLFVGDEEAQIAKFIAGDLDLLNHVSARNVGLLRNLGFAVHDLGPGLEYSALVFSVTNEWFGRLAFRQAVSAAINRENIIELVYGGLASSKLVVEKHSNERAKQLLVSAGFGWTTDGALHDRSGRPVEFTIGVAAGSPDRSAMAALIQDDLKKIGMNVQIAPNRQQDEVALVGLSEVADERPLIRLVSPHVLVAAKPRVQNFRPVIFDHHTLWNADELFVGEGKAKGQATRR